MRTYYTQNNIIILAGSIIIGILAYLLAIKLTHEDIIKDIKEVMTDIRSKKA